MGPPSEVAAASATFVLFCVELIHVEVAGELEEWELPSAELPYGVVLCSEDALTDTMTAFFEA